MHWGLVPRTGATDALLVNRKTGACLTASGGYAVQAACGSAATQGWTFVIPSGPDHVEAPYGLRNTATQTVLTVGPDNRAGTPMLLMTDYAADSQRFWVDWRYTGCADAAPRRPPRGQLRPLGRAASRPTGASRRAEALDSGGRKP